MKVIMYQIYSKKQILRTNSMYGSLHSVLTFYIKQILICSL